MNVHEKQIIGLKKASQEYLICPIRVVDAWLKNKFVHIK